MVIKNELQGQETFKTFNFSLCIENHILAFNSKNEGHEAIKSHKSAECECRRGRH